MASRVNNGGLWHNKYKGIGDSRPDFTGEINIDGTLHKISAWKTDRGNASAPVLAIKVNKAFTKPTATPPSTTPTPVKPIDLHDDWDSDIPF